MASPLSEMQIGSPLPDHKDLISKQLIEGQIEFLSGIADLHEHSAVQMRNPRSLGLDVLNGTWVYTPRYMYENRHPLSYTFGHMQHGGNEEGYVTLLKTLAQKAEQEFYYGPLLAVRKFLIQHDKVSGKTDLLMPDSWSVVIDDDLKMSDFMGVIEGYVQSDQRRAICSAVYEQYYATLRSHSDLPVRLMFSQNKLILVDAGAALVGAGSLFDLTPIMRFISNPKGHGLTQEIFRAYRKLVNL
ncbi:hypothetical protein pEaSNUABM35_00066 [Erwinia phage pEa_SNUABM_35]|uniref:Uncharacterized protein n=1 Tax=Erwinia phage pEa_SNUABM_35 TaxID=2869557 RepID=A0AAE8C4Z6_9CAUD|nr:hypothetical protein MPK65_gp066 [Erwinia phage pEa_SNUABM_35]QZE59983.1 hypothetical protein pEaSNUABM35_00066 [Erwinia phage pEa_SNUABM_35]QZE60319.1 hypothetical protein pEaSNUABM36_00066 [Erwinia phage pEa_SNUABM_36]